MAQLQLVRQNQAGNAHIDGATPSYLPTSINQPNQNMPHRSEFSQDRRQLRHLCPKKDNSDVFPGGFASCLGITLMSFLVVLPPVLGQLWCLSWWFCLLPWDNSDRCSIFWLGWLMDVGRYEGVAPSMWHSQPDFGEWVGVASSMSLKMTYFLQSSTLWQFATLLGPGKRAPPSPPKKNFFLSLPKETWHLVGSVFRGEPKWKIGTALVSPHVFSQHQAAFLGIDGATPTHSPKSGWECPHRWRNSLISPDIHQPT